jgi:cell division protein FtsB
MLLGLALIVLSAVSTLAAFGGETWQPGSTPLIKRVTPRGWVSLVCLASALMLGILKENLDDTASQRLARQRDEARSQLKAANTKLDSVSSNLVATRAQLAAQTKFLTLQRDEARNQLNGVSDALGAARSQLAAQTEINLLATLAKQSPVRDSAWWVEFKAASRNAKDILQLYFSRLPDEYRPVIEGQLHFHPFLGVASHVVYRYRDDGKLTTTFEYVQNGVNPKILPPQFLDDSPFGGMQRQMHRENEQIVSILTQRTATSDKYTSAAIAYRDLARQKAVATVTLRFRREFASEAEQVRFVHLFKAAPVSHHWQNMTTGRYSTEFVMPPDVRGSFLGYWRRALLGSSVHLYLENEASLMISSSVGLGTVHGDSSSVALEFVAITPPQIRVGLEEMQ